MELIEAVQAGDTTRAGELLELGVDTDDASRALPLAVSRGHLPIVGELLQAGADPELPSNEGILAIAAAGTLQAQLVLDYSTPGEPRVLRATHEEEGELVAIDGVESFDDLLQVMRKPLRRR